MKGIDEYNLKIKNKINNYINNHDYEGYLRNFYNFICNDVSYTTAYNYLNFSAKFIEYINKPINEITLNDYTSFLALGKDLTSSYKILSYAALKRFSEYLFVTNQTSEDYMKQIHRPKNIESQETFEKRNRSYLTKDEISIYLNNVKRKLKTSKTAQRDLCLILIFLNTGMRCSALFKLDVNSINFENKTLSVVDKGSKIQKYVLTDNMLDEINKWLIVRSEWTSSTNEDALFITTGNPKRLSRRQIADVIKKYGSGIDKNLSPHKLRATFGTQVYENTNDVYLTQQAMGHSSPNTTELYIRNKQNVSREKAANIMSNILF